MQSDFYAVCIKCLVKAIKHHSYIAGKGRYLYWICPICSTDNLISRYRCGLTEDELDSNLRFLAFMNEIDITDIVDEIWD